MPLHVHKCLHTQKACIHTHAYPPTHTKYPLQHTKGKNQSLHYLCVDSSSRLAAHSFAGGQENSFYKTNTEERHAWRKLINLEAGKGWKIAVRARELLLPGRWRTVGEGNWDRLKPTAHRSFQSIKVAPTVSDQNNIAEDPQVCTHVSCFWLHPNCSLLLTMGKQQGMCLGKRPVVWEQKAFYWEFWYSGANTPP